MLLLWHTVDENFGDVLIYNTVKEFLEMKGFISDYMDVGEPCIKIIQKANEYDFLLFAGGGIIERYVPNVIRYFEEDIIELKVPYGVIGLSIGNFDYSKHLNSISCWIKNATFFYTRDYYSAQKLNQMCGIEKVKVGVDVVWANKRIYQQLNNREIHYGINVRDVPYLDIGEDMNWGKLKEIIIKNGVTIQIPDESQIAIEGLEQYTYSIDEVINQISKCKVIIAMRYHVVLVAALMGIPTIPIVYCNKVHELSSQLNLNRYEVTVPQIGMITDKILDIQRNYNSVKNTLLQRTECMIKSSLDILETITGNIINC